MYNRSRKILKRKKKRLVKLKEKKAECTEGTIAHTN